MIRRNSRLEAARAAGFLHAAGRDRKLLEREYAFWCWRLRVPVVRCERNSPRSKYGRVVLDLFTTPHRLTAAGEAELQRVAEAFGATVALSPSDGVWEKAPAARLDELARAVFRTATRQGSYDVVRRSPPAEIVEMFQAIGEKMALERSA